jgi:hypothetical protein
MRGPIRSVLLAGLALSAFGALTVTPALAQEFIREEKGSATLVPVGTNFVAENVGKAELKAGTLVVKCNESDVGGTLTKNKNTGTIETPVAEVQSVVFGGCSSGTTKVVVNTVTSPVWKLTWTAAKTFSLTGIAAEIIVGAMKCKITNNGVFPLTWENDPDGFHLAELTATKAPVTLTGTGCPATGEETVTYKFEAEGLSNLTNVWWLE